MTAHAVPVESLAALAPALAAHFAAWSAAAGSHYLTRRRPTVRRRARSSALLPGSRRWRRPDSALDLHPPDYYYYYLDRLRFLADLILVSCSLESVNSNFDY